MTERSTARRLCDGLVLMLAVLGASVVVLGWLYTLPFLASEDADLTETGLEDVVYIGSGFVA